MVEGCTDIIDGRQEDEVFDVDDTRSFVSPFQHPTEPGELPALAVGHGVLGQAGEEMAGHHDIDKELVGKFEPAPRREAPLISR